MPPEPRAAAKLWVQVAIMLLLAVFAQAIGLVFAYVSRCKPGQGNDWCGVGSLAGVFFGFGAAVCIVVVGTIIIVLKRKGRTQAASGGAKVGLLRVMSVVFGVLLLLPCAWMLGVGWSRLHSDGGLWLGSGLGVVLIAAAFVPRRQA